MAIFLICNSSHSFYPNSHHPISIPHFTINTPHHPTPIPYTIQHLHIIQLVPYPSKNSNFEFIPPISTWFIPYKFLRHLHCWEDWERQLWTLKEHTISSSNIRVLKLSTPNNLAKSTLEIQRFSGFRFRIQKVLRNQARVVEIASWSSLSSQNAAP